MNEMPPCSIGCCKGAIVMKRTYPIYFEDKEIGTVNLQQSGLYYMVVCQCKLTGNKIFKLYAQCGDRVIKVGTPAPDGDGFSLHANLYLGNISIEQVRFFVLPADKIASRQCLTVTEYAPFPYIDSLECAVFSQDNGKPGIWFSK